MTNASPETFPKPESASYEVEAVAFEGPKTPYRGYTIRASYLKEPHKRDALIELMKDGQLLRRFLFPAYKIYNLQWHFRDIVDGEIENSPKGLEKAAWDGLSGSVILVPNAEVARNPKEQNEKD